MGRHSEFVEIAWRLWYKKPRVALWCNWLTRCPLKAESTGSIPVSATSSPSRLFSENPITYEPFAKFGSALGRPWVSPWERGRPARILVKALLQRQSAGEPTNPVKPIATTLPGLVRAGRPRSQGQQLFSTINPASYEFCKRLTYLFSSILCSTQGLHHPWNSHKTPC